MSLYKSLTRSVSWCLAGIENTTRINAQSLTSGRDISEERNGFARVNEGEDITLFCTAEGSGDLQYDWFHNGRKIPKNKTRRLVLNAFSASESGSYTCLAKNGAGHSKFNVPFGLSTSRANTLVRFTKDTVATLDSAVRLPCSFEPTTAVDWFFRGALLGQTSQ